MRRLSFGTRRRMFTDSHRARLPVLPAYDAKRFGSKMS